MQITLFAYSPCQPVPHLCASGTACGRYERGPQCTGCGVELPGSAGAWASTARRTLVFVFLEKQMPDLLAADAQSSLSRTQSLICYSEHQVFGVQMTPLRLIAPLQGVDWRVQLQAKLVLFLSCSANTRGSPGDVVAVWVPPSLWGAFPATSLVLCWFCKTPPLLAPTQIFQERLKLKRIVQDSRNVT